MASYSAFKNFFISFIWPINFDAFGINSLVRWQLLTRFWMGLSHMNEHKFKHNFCDFLNSCKLEPETVFHYLLHCHLFQIERKALLNDIKEIDEHMVTDHKNDLDQIVLGFAIVFHFISMWISFALYERQHYLLIYLFSFCWRYFYTDWIHI